MIKCTIPDSYPLLEFADYGCYCGLGGGGTAVDELDRFIRLCFYKAFTTLCLLVVLRFCTPVSSQLALPINVHKTFRLLGMKLSLKD